MYLAPIPIKVRSQGTSSSLHQLRTDCTRSSEVIKSRTRRPTLVKLWSRTACVTVDTLRAHLAPVCCCSTTWESTHARTRARVLTRMNVRALRRAPRGQVSQDTNSLAATGLTRMFQYVGQGAMCVHPPYSPMCVAPTAIVVGGTHIGEQRADLRSGVHIVVATPGRFIDHLQQGNSSIARVSVVVLDEADRMLDMGFEPQIREVIVGYGFVGHAEPSQRSSDVTIQCNDPRRDSNPFTVSIEYKYNPKHEDYLNLPVRVKVGRTSSPTSNVTQVLEKVAEDDKIDTLLALLVDEAAHAGRRGQNPPLTIVFVERKARCDEVTTALTDQGLKATALHGGRSQNERESALWDFRKGFSTILVATDVASRGLDVTGVAHVVNLDLPKTTFIVGRTGRAGTIGRATSFYADRDAFLASQIRRALSDAESGNALAFATGKAARRKERELAAAFREGQRAPSAVAQIGGTTVRVEDKYKYMLRAS